MIKHKEKEKTRLEIMENLRGHFRYRIKVVQPDPVDFHSSNARDR